MTDPQVASLLQASRAVGELCRAMDARNVPVIAAQLSDDAVWTIVGRPDRFAFGGPQPKAGFVEGLQGSLAAFEAFSFTVESWAKNGDTVFVEAQVEALGPGGARYSNHYLIRFLLRDGLIIQALEHYDPFEALVFVEQLSGKS
jgi:ketosteroid isomerase-like protein